jgi:hypothetical protein
MIVARTRGARELRGGRGALTVQGPCGGPGSIEIPRDRLKHRLRHQNVGGGVEVIFQTRQLFSYGGQVVFGHACAF